MSAAAVGRWLDGERTDRSREMAKEVAQISGGLPEEREGRVSLDARGLGSDWQATEFRAFWERFASAFTAAVAAHRATDAEPTVAPDRGGHTVS
jgi:hypothetical protein